MESSSCESEIDLEKSIKNNSNKSIECHSLSSSLSPALTTVSFVGSNKGIPTTGFFTTCTSMLPYSMSSKYIHSISCIRKTQRVSRCRMAAIQSGHTLSGTVSTSDASLLSALSSTCLQDWQWFDIILIVPKYIPQSEHIRFFKSSLTAGLNASFGIPRGYFR